MQKLSEARHFKDISKNRNFQDISKNRTLFQKMHPHASDFCHQSCLPDSWWLASSIDQRPSRPTKEKMTSQQIKTNSYHILPCSDNNYQVQILTIYSLTRSRAEPDLLRSQAETCQRLPNCCSRVVRAELQNCKARSHRGYGSQPGAAAETILQSANMNQKPMKVKCRTFQKWTNQYESETNGNLCRTFQTWTSQHESETMHKQSEPFPPNMQTTKEN